MTLLCQIAGCEDTVRAKKSALCSKHYIKERNYGPEVWDLPDKCEVCGARDNLHVDHDHMCCPSPVWEKPTCGKCIRGRLCRSCNVALGYLNEDFDRIRALAQYALDRCVY